MSVTGRRGIREDVVSALRARLVPDYALTVPDDQPIVISGSPVVVVASAGTERTRITFGGSAAKVYLDVFVLVRSSSTTDDRMDIIEQQVAQFVEDNQKGPSWTAIDYDGRSDLLPVEDRDGNLYRQERIPLVFTARL